MNRPCLAMLLYASFWLADWVSSRAEGDSYQDLIASLVCYAFCSGMALVFYDAPKTRQSKFTPREPPLDSMAYTDNVG